MVNETQGTFKNRVSLWILRIHSNFNIYLILAPVSPTRRTRVMYLQQEFSADASRIDIRVNWIFTFLIDFCTERNNAT